MAENDGYKYDVFISYSSADRTWALELAKEFKIKGIKTFFDQGGGMVSVELKATVAQAKKVCSSFQVFSLAESLGGVESLIDHPASMTHASIPAAERRAAGLQDGLIRLSCGIEDADDLIADLEQALRKLK